MNCLAVNCFAPVHPHACGENASRLLSSAAGVGSPPRVWGKLFLQSGALRSQRFTPTRVGKTRMSISVLMGSAVHPHACGENAEGCGVLAEVDGSPPRVWGKRL